MTTAHDQTSSIVSSLNKLTNYIEAEDFKGYDPYDILHSNYRYLKLGNGVSLLQLSYIKEIR